MNILIIEATSKRKPLAEDYSDTSIVHCRNSPMLLSAATLLLTCPMFLIAKF